MNSGERGIKRYLRNIGCESVKALKQVDLNKEIGLDIRREAADTGTKDPACDR